MNVFSILFIIFYMKMAFCESTQNCPKRWTQFQNKCFMFYTDKSFLNFYESHIVCKDFFNATLVSIHSLEEQTFLVNYAFSINKAQNHIWIGARRLSNDTFVWEDNSPFDYTNWAKTQPNNLEGKHFCASLLQSPNLSELGNWYDDPCADRYHVMCQIYLKDNNTSKALPLSTNTSEKKNTTISRITLNEFKTLYNKTLTNNSTTISALIASTKEEQHFSHTNTILTVVTVIQFLVIVFLVFIVIRKNPMNYRTLVMSECNRNSNLT